MKLTHVDEFNNPAMVDISEKSISKRVAISEGFITLPVEVFQHIQNSELQVKKGPVVQTAIIAGTMAVEENE